MHYKEAKSILSQMNGMNIYRGCEHGCIYCDSRSLCYNMDHAFEDIEVKVNAPELLEDALCRKRQRCVIATGSMSDPYMPLEEKLCLTRRCEELVLRYGFGFDVLTKSDLILRDTELLRAINEKSKCVVQMTLTTFDESLCRIVEPNVCTTARRAEVLMRMKGEGIPTVVWLSPILPFINDTEENLRGIMDICFEAGVKGIMAFGMGVTLRRGDREYFYKKLDAHFPGVKAKYMRAFGDSYECPSPRAQRLWRIFDDECSARSVMNRADDIFSYLHRFEQKGRGEQLSFL